MFFVSVYSLLLVLKERSSFTRIGDMKNEPRFGSRE